MDRRDLYKKFGLDENADRNGSRKDREEIGQGILGDIHKSLGFEQEKSKARWFSTEKITYAIAASVALLLAAYFGMDLYKKPGTAKSDFITVNAPAGTVKEVNLPDGSTVWLNAASTLRYPRAFGSNREVYLEEGEGFFEVKRDTTSPFIVHAANLQTRVLGTSFRVKSYQALSNIKVSVVSGKVAVNDGEKSLAILEKNEEITFSKADKKQVETVVEAKEAVKWQTGDVVLKSVYFEDMILAIENAYQVRITYNKETFRKCENSIRFSTRQDVKEVLDLVKDIQGITYEKQGKEVIISGVGCN